MTSLQSPGSACNVELRNFHEISPEPNQKIRSAGIRCPPRWNKSNPQRNNKRGHNLKPRVPTKTYWSESVSSLDASFVNASDTTDSDDEVFQPSIDPVEEGMPGLETCSMSDNLTKGSSSRWETQHSHFSVPSTPRKKNFEIQRQMDRNPTAPRRASCDNTHEIQRQMDRSPLAPRRASCDNANEIQRQMDRNPLVPTRASRDNIDTLPSVVAKLPKISRRGSCDTTPLLPLRYVGSMSDFSETSGVNY
jgi:hypothetical protein